MASPSIGEILALAGLVIDPHLATVNPSIQWFADGNLVGSGDTLLAFQSLAGASVFASVSWTVPWLWPNAEGIGAPAPSLVRHSTPAPSIVEHGWHRVHRGEDLFWGDDVRLVPSPTRTASAQCFRGHGTGRYRRARSGDAHTLTSLDFETVLSCAFSFRTAAVWWRRGLPFGLGFLPGPPFP